MTTFVTISPPTPNGDLHLGHLSGPFLAADVYTRNLKMHGKDAYLISYSDDYQSYIACRARQKNVSNTEIFTQNTHLIKKSLKLANIEIDHFMTAHENPIFREEIKRYYNALHEVKAIDREDTLVPYCESCAAYGYEAFGRTKCDVCGASTDLSQCENCATQPVYNRQEVTCVLCGGAMKPMQMNREYIDVSKYHDLIASSHSCGSYRLKLATFLVQELKRKGQKWYIDRPHDSGISVSFGGKENNVHTWFAGLSGYKASIRELFSRSGEENRCFDPKEDKLACFFGFDCSYSHAVIYPMLALLSGEDPSKNEYFSNAFLKLDDKDFSTSRNQAIWVNDVLPKYDSDNVRYFLCLKAPEEKPENFVFKDFVAWEANVEEHKAKFLSELATIKDYRDIVGRLLENIVADIRKDLLRFMEHNRFSAKGLATLAEKYRKKGADHQGKGPQYIAFNLIYAYVAMPIMPKFASAVFSQQPELRKMIGTIINA